MLIDVLERPLRERVWNWDGTPEQAAEIHAHLDAYSRALGLTTRFIDHGDNTATVENDTYMYGTSRYPVDAHRWYRINGHWGGIEPIPTSEAEINSLYVAYPSHDKVFADVPVDPEESFGDPRPYST